MQKAIPIKHLFSIVFLFQILACNNGNEATSNAPQVDSTQTQILSSDSSISSMENEEDSEGPFEIEYDYLGEYVGKDTSMKLILAEDGVSYYLGYQLKMKGNPIISMFYDGDSGILYLSPYGREKKEIELYTHFKLDEAGLIRNAQWVIWQAETLYRKPVVKP